MHDSHFFRYNFPNSHAYSVLNLPSTLICLLCAEVTILVVILNWKMAKHVNTYEFDGSQEVWIFYTKHLQLYFTAMNITSEEEKESYSSERLWSVDSSTHQEPLDNNNANRQEFLDINQLISNYPQPKPSVIMQHFKIHPFTQKPENLTTKFVVKIRKLSKLSRFGETLHDVQRDRFVCRLNDGCEQHCFLAEEDLTFQTAFSMAQTTKATK